MTAGRGRINVRPAGIVFSFVAPAAREYGVRDQAGRQGNQPDADFRVQFLERLHHVIHREELVAGQPEYEPGFLRHASERFRAAQRIGACEI